MHTAISQACAAGAAAACNSSTHACSSAQGCSPADASTHTTHGQHTCSTAMAVPVHQLCISSTHAASAPSSWLPVPGQMPPRCSLVLQHQRGSPLGCVGILLLLLLGRGLLGLGRGLLLGCSLGHGVLLAPSGKPCAKQQTAAEQRQQLLQRTLNNLIWTAMGRISAGRGCCNWAQVGLGLY